MGKKKGGIKEFKLREGDELSAYMKLPGGNTEIQFHSGSLKIDGKTVRFSPYFIVRNYKTEELEIDEMWVAIT